MMPMKHDRAPCDQRNGNKAFEEEQRARCQRDRHETGHILHRTFTDYQQNKIALLC